MCIYIHIYIYIAVYMSRNGCTAMFHTKNCQTDNLCVKIPKLLP